MPIASEPIRAIVKDLGDPLFWQLSRAELKRRLAKHPGNSADEITAVTKHYRGWGWYKRLSPYQIDLEFRQLAAWAREQQPKVVVEIGTASGGTLLMWSRVTSKRVISIDLPGGIHGGGYPAQKMRLFREYANDRPGLKIDLYRENSQDPVTRDRVARSLAGEPVDILFIDGDHRLEGVARDFDLWSTLVRPGGHIVFHDILPNPSLPSSQVDVFWQRLSAQHPGKTKEIIDAPDQGWAGIGILTV